MLKIKGLDELTKALEDTQKALGALDGRLGCVQFDPHNPASIEAAISTVEQIIDEKLGSSRSNPIVAPLAEAAKDQFRQVILDKAAIARLGNKDA
jgi:hypothetical protein